MGVVFPQGFSKSLSYNVKEDTGEVDYEQLQEIAFREKPRLIVAGASAYSREWDYAQIRRIADEIGAIFMVDMAHPAGLIAARITSSLTKFSEAINSIPDVCRLYSLLIMLKANSSCFIVNNLFLIN